LLNLPEVQDGVSEGLGEGQCCLIGPLSEMFNQCLGKLRAEMGIRWPRWSQETVYDTVWRLRHRPACQQLSEPWPGEGQGEW
jgi:hypothetical protein